MELTTIAQKTLDRMDDARRLKARCGLEDDTMRVTIMAEHHNRVSAIVRSGDEKIYEVSISEEHTRCTCPDYVRRSMLCKHIGATCYMLLGTTTPEVKQPFQCGDRVQLRGLHRPGKVVCVSHDLISVRWEPMGFKPGFSMAYNRVELERATV